MSNGLADNPFDGLLAAVKRPTAPSSSLDVAGPAVEASSLPASAAFFSTMTESAPEAPTGRGKGAPAVPTAAGASLSVELSPAVALILSLCLSAKGWSADEVIARAIVLFAQDIGVPSLVTEIELRKGRRHANSESADLHAVPRFARTAPSRFTKGV